jgi:hypothetical protein
MLAATICPVLAKQPQEQQSSQQQQTSQSPPAQLGAETPPNSQPGQPEPKKKKVWTNDEVVSLRTPADNYQIQKEAQEAAVAQAAAKEAAEANLPKEAEPTIKLPSTIEETQQLIKNKEEQINDEQNGLERLIKELPDAPEDQKPAMQREIDRVAMDVPKVRNELKLLQNHLEKLTSAQLNEASVSPPASPPL